MSPAQVVEHFGTQKAAAQALGLSQPTISEWVTNGYVPHARQFQVELVTGGALKADATDPRKVAA